MPGPMISVPSTVLSVLMTWRKAMSSARMGLAATPGSGPSWRKQQACARSPGVRIGRSPADQDGRLGSPAYPGLASPDFDGYGFARGSELFPAALEQGEPRRGVRDCESPVEAARGIRHQAVPQDVRLVVVTELDDHPLARVSGPLVCQPPKAPGDSDLAVAADAARSDRESGDPGGVLPQVNDLADRRHLERRRRSVGPVVRIRQRRRELSRIGPVAKS